MLSRSLVALVFALAATPSFAEDVVITSQGRLLDASDAPVTTRSTLTFGLYTDAFNPTLAAVWSEGYTVQPGTGGTYAVLLGDTAGGKKPLPAAIFLENPKLFLGVTIDAVALMPRVPLTRVALASAAALADRATSADALDCEGCVTKAMLDPAYVGSVDAATVQGAALTTTPAANGVPRLDVDGKLATGFLPDVDAKTLRGAAPSTTALPGALAQLDETGKLPAGLLPTLNAATLGGAAPSSFALKSDISANALLSIAATGDRLGVLRPAPLAALDVDGAGTLVALDIAGEGCAAANVARLAGSPDLTRVKPGDVFIDEARNAFRIATVDPAARTLGFTGTCVEDGTNDALAHRPGLHVRSGNVSLGGGLEPQAKLAVGVEGGMPIVQANKITFDSEQGQGLANMIGGARLVSDTPPKESAPHSFHTYLSTRGVSRLGLHDGAFYLDVGGATGVPGAPVNWETMIAGGVSQTILPNVSISNGGCATAGSVQLAAGTVLTAVVAGDVFYDAAGVSFVITAVDATNARFTIGAAGLGGGGSGCSDTGSATPKVLRNAVWVPYTNLGIGTAAPLSPIDVAGSAIRIRTPFTPTGSSDARGNVGDLSWDAGYVYVKTAAGWRRSALATF